MSAFVKEQSGKKYGYWRVVSFHKIDPHGDARWWCKCESCGHIYSVRGFSLRNGSTKHCRHCNKKGCDD